MNPYVLELQRNTRTLMRRYRVTHNNSFKPRFTFGFREHRYFFNIKEPERLW